MFYVALMDIKTGLFSFYDISYKAFWLFIAVNNSKSLVFRLSHDVVTCDVDREAMKSTDHALL